MSNGSPVHERFARRSSSSCSLNTSSPYERGTAVITSRRWPTPGKSVQGNGHDLAIVCTSLVSDTPLTDLPHKISTTGLFAYRPKTFTT